MAFWSQWRYHDQIQITSSSYHKNQILKNCHLCPKDEIIYTILHTTVPRSSQRSLWTTPAMSSWKRVATTTRKNFPFHYLMDSAAAIRVVPSFLKKIYLDRNFITYFAAFKRIVLVQAFLCIPQLKTFRQM